MKVYPKLAILIFVVCQTLAGWAALGAPISGTLRAPSPSILRAPSPSRAPSREASKPLELIPIPPAILERNMLKDQIFDYTLSREFERRYEDEFGRTEAEVSYRDRSRLDTVQGPNGELVSIKQNTQKERDFGMYMLRRALEYHFDKYAKTQENLKHVQEVKEKVTNYEVPVAPGMSFKAQYSISGNYFDFEILNPYLISRMRLEMGQRGISPSEARIFMERDLTTNLSIEYHYTVIDGIAALILKRALTPNSYVSLTGSTYTKPEGPSIREHLGLVGYNLTF